VGDTEVWSNEWFERGGFDGRIECLEGAAHQAEVNRADDRGMLDSDLAEGAGVHGDSLAAALAL
jgi:hypothetical protein